MSNEPPVFTDRERRWMDRAERGGGRRLWAVAAAFLVAGGLLASVVALIGWRCLAIQPAAPTAAEVAAAEAAVARVEEAGLMKEVRTAARVDWALRGDGPFQFWAGVALGVIGLAALFCFAVVARLLLVLADIGPVAASARLGRKLIAALHAWEAERAAADARDGDVPP